MQANYDDRHNAQQMGEVKEVKVLPPEKGKARQRHGQHD